ncbi:hypothetical protein [Candidatus Xianfuyuplasma coldseepsis]|uniref:Uncharacterized protein n=1 Tax=Candidatus Xianfuyuplasma coldseepsis TaxID=2782163 RepID=A0A7L7KPM2_9MOLU|nr:hypothetical protein [Xianfuyuplasma coldseepsis]QMS84741.1 hypothetical protein G4Z02_02890 [Xianfuyuplasma coldseepsis]
MKNPFVQNGEMLPVASINSVFVENEKAYDLFRPSLILEKLIEYMNMYGLYDMIESTSVLYLFDQLLLHDSKDIKQGAEELADMFGDRLASVLTTLLQPSEISIKNRTNWSSVHWDYWKTIRKIYLVGGLTSPLLTQRFYQRIQRAFEQKDIEDVTVTFIEGSQNMGTRGLASITKNGDYMLFDFGQTKIKRARVLKDRNTTIIESYLDPVDAKYLYYKNTSKATLVETASELDGYICKTIIDAIHETGFTGNKIYMSIANYVSQGAIYSARGGYGKLAYIGENYQQHLEQKLAEMLNKQVTVRLFHDTSAMALLFRHEPHTAVISLGTAFGVAFPHDSVYS